MNETLDKRGGEGTRIRNITKRNITPLNEDNGTIGFSFSYKLFLLKSCSNKIGILVKAFEQWHHEAPDEDFNNLGGRIAGICKTMNNDYGYVLEILWTSVPRSPNGSHLNYIQGVINQKKKQEKEQSVKRSFLVTPMKLKKLSDIDNEANPIKEEDTTGTKNITKEK